MRPTARSVPPAGCSSGLMSRCAPSARASSLPNAVDLSAVRASTSMSSWAGMPSELRDRADPPRLDRGSLEADRQRVPPLLEALGSTRAAISRETRAARRQPTFSQTATTSRPFSASAVPWNVISRRGRTAPRGRTRRAIFRAAGRGSRAPARGSARTRASSPRGTQRDLSRTRTNVHRRRVEDGTTGRRLRQAEGMIWISPCPSLRGCAGRADDPPETQDARRHREAGRADLDLARLSEGRRPAPARDVGVRTPSRRC